VISIAVPKVVTVEKKASSPSSVRSRSLATISLAEARASSSGGR
jgi:hypothetical protein